MDYKNKFIFHSNDLPIQSFLFFEAKREEFCDITLKVGKRSIAAHRMILSAALPYFYNIFCEKEGLTSREKEINFPDVDSDALKSLIDFAYTCQIEINDDNVKHLLSAACVLHVEQVKNECLRFLINNLKPENALSTREILCKVCSSEELEKVDLYIRYHFEELSRTNHILNLSFDVLKDFTKDDNLNVENEECVYEIILKWVKQYPEERKHHLPHLLSNVRMSFIKPSYIRNHILKEELIRTSIECRDLVDEAMYYHTTPEARVEACRFVTSPRNLSGNVHKDVNGSSGIYVLHFKIENVVQSLNADDAEWKITHNSNWISQYIRQTAAELNKRIYSFFPKFTYVYNLEQNVFSFCKGMTLPREMAASVSHDNKVYVLGGFVCDGQTTEATNAVQCFDPKFGEWTVLSGMNICRGGLGTVASGEFIYSLGGLNSNRVALNYVERFNVKSRFWTMMPPMLTERSVQGCAMLDDKIFVCGGWSKDKLPLSTAEVFDPIVNVWKFITSPKNRIVMCKLLPFCGKLYSFEVLEDKESTECVEIYEPEANGWKCGPPLKMGSVSICAVVVNLSSE